MAKSTKIMSLVLASIIAAGSMTGCSKKAAINSENPVVTVMTTSFNVDSAAADSPVMLALEEHIGADLDITWVPSSSYEEKMVATMGAGTYPMAMLVLSTSASIIQNSRIGSFWEIGSKIKDAAKYPNLAQTNDIVNNNISIDGKLYGLYRSRTLGRYGVSIRKDWLDNLGLSQPTTIDEFYNVLKAFRNNDPDKNGKDDTFGMILTTAQTSYQNMAVWFGAPNEWGEDETGKLQPDFLTDEYFESLKFFKKLYDEGLVNQDLATYDGNLWDEQFLSGKAGVIIDVADRARRLQTNIAKIDPKAVVDVFGYVKKDENAEIRTLPTTGYNGYYVFPKAALPSETDIDFVLGVMDKMNDQEAQNLTNYGIEGVHYSISADGYVELVDDPTLVKDYADLNQVATTVVPCELVKAYANETAKTVDVVYKDNENYAIGNPAAALISDTYSRKGVQLDNIIAEADTRFIVGQITEEQYKAELQRWKDNGGNDVIAEMNEQYQLIK